MRSTSGAISLAYCRCTSTAPIQAKRARESAAAARLSFAICPRPPPISQTSSARRVFNPRVSRCSHRTERRRLLNVHRTNYQRQEPEQLLIVFGGGVDVGLGTKVCLNE